MKKSNITSILKQIISEDADKARAEHLGTLRGYLEGNLIPKINMAVKRDGISQAFASELVSDIQKRLDMIQSSDSLSKVGPGMKESSLSPAYLTNIYSSSEALEATIYTTGDVSITLRSGGKKLKMTASIPLSELNAEYLKGIIEETGFEFDESFQKEVDDFLVKIKSNPKVQSIENT